MRGNYKVVSDWAAREPAGQARRLTVRFWLRPVEIQGDQRVQRLMLERTRLDDSGAFTGTGELETLEVSMVLRSVGYQVTTVVNTGGASPAFTVTEVDSYVVGQESYRTDVTVHNNTGGALPMTVYRAGDCFLQNSDVGYGRVDGSAVACRARNDDGTPGDRIEQWAPITGGSSY